MASPVSDIYHVEKSVHKKVIGLCNNNWVQTLYLQHSVNPQYLR